MGCILFLDPPNNNYSICVCTFDHNSKKVYPCFNATVWSDHMCSSCQADGFCDSPSKGGMRYACNCRNRTKSEGVVDKPYCVARQLKGIRKLWIDYSNETFVLPEILETTRLLFTTPTSTTTTTSPPAAMHAKTATSRPNQREIVTAPETIKAMGFE
ncbi:hypothetical protein OSTOST_08789, partial [Ostertagia ostertagi]